tara:strand:+ start:20730 stop:21638 length:909 start_codon:yes stop_codon:yes gene_type:complete
LNKKALIIGFGSIGQKHAHLLSRILGEENISLLTSRDDVNFRRVDSLDEAAKSGFDYYVVACETSRHYDLVKEIEDKIRDKLVLIEKPLFDTQKEISLEKNDYFVGYNLRFHPLLIRLRDLIESEDVISANIICNSYLPNWRENINYEDSSSANKDKGGGVLLDLSHEIDFLIYLVGNISYGFSYNRKISSLQINTDDVLFLNGSFQKNGLYSIYLNYFSNNLKRLIMLETKDASYELDFLNSKLKIYSQGKLKELKRENFNFNSTYNLMHKAILSRKFDGLCTISEAQKTMSIIRDIQESR